MPARAIWRDNSSNEDGFEVFYRPEGPTQWISVATTPADTSSALFTLPRIDCAFVIHEVKVHAYYIADGRQIYSSASKIVLVMSPQY